jgi:hypothetical protein
MTATVTMVDTSVLCELLQVPGKSDPARSADVRAEVDRRWREGEHFVIPITTVIETGNHIAQADGNRYEVARRLVALLRIAVSEESHWRVLQTRLGAEFLTALCDGDSTGQSLEALAAARVGAGDVAILVERDQFLSATAIRRVQVWTFDEGLAAQASARP